MSRQFVAVALVLICVCGTAQAMSSTVTPVATVNGDGTTTFHLKICICLTPEEIAAYNAAVAGGAEEEVELHIGAPIQVVENDPINDDELGSDGAEWQAGPITVSLAGQTLMPCPPEANQTCVLDPNSRTVSTSSYRDPGDPPPEGQYGDGAGNEGVVPPGTTVGVPGVTPCAPTFP